jgi:hypothetical protein
MSLDWLPPIFIMCHPEYEPIRYKILCEHLPRRGIPLDKVTWVRGPWGSTLTSTQYFAEYDPFEERFGSKMALNFKSAGLLRGEVSLVLTFKEVIWQALCNGADIVVVFESDIVLREDFLERLQKLLEKARGRSDWEYISLGEGVGTRPPGHTPSYFSETELYSPGTLFPFRCTDSMVFRRQYLEILEQTMKHFRECLDWELNVHLQAVKGRALWADPPLVEPGSGRWRFLSLLPG